MEIVRENINGQSALLRVKITPVDYQKEVDTAIKKYQKQAVMPGFRTGHVPAGMIKKMYGKSFLADELNKIVSTSVNSYIQENKLQVLGDPLPMENGTANNFENPADFEFLFEIGLAPEINLNLPFKTPVDAYEIIVDEKRVEDYIVELRRRYGKFSNPEVSDDQCILYGELTELTDTGEIKEGGLKKNATIALDLVKDSDSKQKLTAKRKDDVVVLNLMTAMQDAAEVAYMLGIEKEKAVELKSDFSYKIISVNLVEKAELTQEFFDKAFGKDSVTNESQMRERAKSDIAAMFENETRHKLNHDMEDALLHEININLPDEFLKRWIHTASEKPLTTEEIEKDYPHYSRDMKLKLIENKIASQNDFKITDDEIKEYARGLILQQFSGYAQQLSEDLITDFVKRYLEKKENIAKASEGVKSQKVFEWLNQNANKNVKQVSYDEFVKIVRDHKH